MGKRWRSLSTVWRLLFHWTFIQRNWAITNVASPNYKKRNSLQDLISGNSISRGPSSIMGIFVWSSLSLESQMQQILSSMPCRATLNLFWEFIDIPFCLRNANFVADWKQLGIRLSNNDWCKGWFFNREEEALLFKDSTCTRTQNDMKYNMNLNLIHSS